MKKTLVTWCVLFGLLLQSAAWAVPAERAGQAERLAHAVAHALDHGHHGHPQGQGDAHAHEAHDSRGHEVDSALQGPDTPEPADHGPHHSHASDAGQVQGLPVAVARPSMAVVPIAHTATTRHQPPSADPDGLLRPPQPRA